MRISYRPLPAIWPSGERTLYRRHAPFKADWTSTMALLERELRQLGADVAILEAGFSESDIRIDGLPKANARPNDPGVVLNFESKYGPLRYGCDSFWSYQANLRAIALGLEALRKVDRYGVTKRGEQYAGWKALPAVGGSQSSREHEAFIRGFAAPGLSLEQAYRVAAKQVHPDVGGTREQWDQLQRAKAALGL